MEHGVAMNIACSERGDSNMYMMKIGHVIPFYSTSAGRVFMAYMDRKQALEILERDENKDYAEYKNRAAGVKCRA